MYQIDPEGGILAKYSGYYAYIAWSSKDKTYVGQVLGIKDHLVFEGRNAFEAEEQFHKSIDDYLETLKELDAQT